MHRRSFLAAVAAGAAGLLAPVAASAQYFRPKRGERWQLLGSKRVGFVVDRDVVPVGTYEGGFRAIRIDVKNNEVHFIDVVVIYGNGQPDRIPVNRNIPRGGSTGYLDLKGDVRLIKEIQLTYKSRPSFRGQAVVEVYGLHVDGPGRGPGFPPGPPPGPPPRRF